MVAIAVALTLAVCLLLDWWLRRRSAPVAPAASLEPARGLSLGPPRLAGGSYQDGWLLTVRAPELGHDLNNLLSGAVADRWLEGESARLRSWLHPNARLSFPDGGRATDDIGRLIPDTRWCQLVRRLLRVDPAES